MAHRPIVSLIAALADNRVIGRHNRLPWHLPADLQHFKQLTLDKPIIMGRRTWESLPGLLPRRTHIVVSRNPAYRAHGCILVATPDAAIEAAGDAPEVMVVGGADIYRQMLSMAQRMYLTLVHESFEGDAVFPEWNAREWSQIDRQDFPSDDNNRYCFSFVTLERRG